MKILAIDIGAGTEDVLLYDNQKKSIENCVKMVLPAPSQVFAARVREVTKLYKDIFIRGGIIGGGAFSVALREHIKKELQVIMTKNAAYTVEMTLTKLRNLVSKLSQEKKSPQVSAEKS